MNKQRKAYIESCEVSYTERADLGGYSQVFAVEGRKKDLPVVLFLHGGPGSPIPFSVGCRGLFPQFTDKFIMVYWDQLGCGINNRPIDDGFTVSNFADMTVDLIKLLRERFKENKLYVFGTSWGSILSLYAAVRVPKLIDGVIVNGQVLSAPMFSQDAYSAIERSSAPEKQKTFVRSLPENGNGVSLKDGMRLSKIIRKYTDGYTNRNSEPAPVMPIIKGMKSSPDYRFKDFIAVFKNGYAKNQSLMREMCSSDLRDLLGSVTVPYTIFQGDTDIVTSTKAITEFIDGCANRNLSYKILPDTGHFPTAKAMEEIFGYLCEISS